MKVVSVQKLILISAISAFLCLSGCAQSTGANAVASSSSSSSSAGKTAEGSIVGEGSISVANHRVEVKGGKVTVDGVSFGEASESSTVRYLVTPSGAKLFVDGQLRNAAAG